MKDTDTIRDAIGYLSLHTELYYVTRGMERPPIEAIEQRNDALAALVRLEARARTAARLLDENILLRQKLAESVRS